MSSEQASRSTVIKNFRALGAHCVRIEDALRAGVPDLNVSWRGNDCWMEFKYVKELPKRPVTPVKIGLRPEQVIWLTERAKAGGRVAVITLIEPRTWVLYQNDPPPDADIFPQYLKYLAKGMSYQDLLNQSDKYWTGDFKPEALEVLKYIMWYNGQEKHTWRGPKI